VEPKSVAKVLREKVEQKAWGQPFPKVQNLAQPFPKVQNLAQPFPKVQNLAQPFPKVE